jgi:2-keto-4-pentenoate hydratase/2-oxohepta-3-ene-1,7-dioic acid hydratase in catechol pathway
MELMRLGPAGRERPVARAGMDTYDLSSLCADIDGAFLAAGGIGRAREAIEAGSLPRIDRFGKTRIGAPIARPQSVVCVGQNYAAHAAEMGAEPPAEPVVFLKHPNTVVGPYDDVLLPPGADKVDWEVELAVVIGRRARYLDSPTAAADHIAGYCVSNDVSERGYQFERSGGQWSKGKCCETFNPLGPSLVPADDVVDVDAMRIWSAVNGERRQDSSTADMIFSATYLVWHLSQYLVLEPGDVINTGTPQGVALSGRFPYLQPGDVYEGGIDGLGSQRQVTSRSTG